MNDIFYTPAIIWFLIGLALLLGELVLPGLIILFFGIGAWITAALVLIFDISFSWQLVAFMVSSILSLAGMRSLLLKRLGIKRNSVNELSEEFIGHTCVVSTSIVPGPSGGKVSFKGTTWKAKSEFPIEEGTTVRIIAKESIVLIVEPNK